MVLNVLGFRHTGIIVSDMAKSLFFYESILGLQVIQKFSDNSQYINQITQITNGSVDFIKLRANDGYTLELLQYPTHPTSKHDLGILNVGILHIAIHVESAIEAYDHLLSHGITPLSRPILSSEGFAKVFFCLDPDNVRVEFVEML